MATGDTESILCDDQRTFHRAFSLAAKLLRLKNYVMFETSEQLLEQIPPEPDNIRVCYLDWNLKTSKKLVHGPLVAEVKTRLPNARIYIISTSEDQKEMDEARQHGASGWIVKTDLIQVLKKFQNEHEEVDDWKVWR